MSIELLRSSMAGGGMIPELHFVCTGLSMLKSYGLEERERENARKEEHEKSRKFLNTESTKDTKKVCERDEYLSVAITTPEGVKHG
jgi:hypothetical protein